MDPNELDARIRSLPPAYGVQHFKNGISAMSQISGKERKDMARILLACLVGKVPRGVILTYRALLDFIYISQYPTHDDVTLGYLQDSLDLYHKHKSVLVNLGVRDHLNIPKFHSLLHYIDAIKQFGATDNYNTEAFERLHIDVAKEAWRGSNKRNATPQMVAWLERVEKVAGFSHYLQQLSKYNVEDEIGLQKPHALQLANKPHCSSQMLVDVAQKHKCPGFEQDLKTFLNQKLPFHLSRADLDDIQIPFRTVDVYHGFKFTLDELGLELGPSERDNDAVKARPERGKQPAQFDTVVVMVDPECELTGLEGE